MHSGGTYFRWINRQSRSSPLWYLPDTSSAFCSEHFPWEQPQANPGFVCPQGVNIGYASRGPLWVYFNKRKKSQDLMQRACPKWAGTEALGPRTLCSLFSLCKTSVKDYQSCELPLYTSFLQVLVTKCEVEDGRE